MSTKNIDSIKLKKKLEETLKTLQKQATKRIFKLLKSHCKFKLPPNGLRKWLENQYQSQVRIEPPKIMKTNTQKGSLILTQNEDVKHRVSHKMIKICYGLKGLYQVAGEEIFWTLNLKEKIWKQN